MTSLAVLTRILPPEAIEEVDGLLDEVQAQQLAMHAADLERLKASPLLAEAPKDAATCHAVSDISLDAKTAIANLEASRKARTAPLRDEESRVNALYGLVTGPLKEIVIAADRGVLAFNQAERALEQRERDETNRRQAEAARAEAEAVAAANAAKTEDERKAAMARAEAASMEIAMAQAADPKAAPQGYRSAAGTSSVVKKMVLDSFDPDKIEDKYWMHPTVQEALLKVLSAAVRSGYHQIPGVTIREDESIRGRRR